MAKISTYVSKEGLRFQNPEDKRLPQEREFEKNLEQKVKIILLQRNCKYFTWKKISEISDIEKRKKAHNGCHCNNFKEKQILPSDTNLIVADNTNHIFCSLVCIYHFHKNGNDWTRQSFPGIPIPPILLFEEYFTAI